MQGINPSNSREHQQQDSIIIIIIIIILLISPSSQEPHLKRFDKDKLKNLNIAKRHVLQS